jgi:hypothetical protein
MTFASRLAAATLAAMLCWSASAQQPAPQPPPRAQPGPSTYGPDELLGAGHKFFGNVSRGLASVIERAVSQWGLPNGYVLGEEGSGAFVAGLRYGEGTLYTKNAGDLRVYWQGPSVGFDWGGDGARTMALVYNLPSTGAIYQRFAGINGSAYIVGGFGMTALTANGIVLVPIRPRPAAWRQYRLSQIHAERDLEPVLIARSPVMAIVIAGPDPAIHPSSKDSREEGWIRGSSPRMTPCVVNGFTLTRHSAGLCTARYGNGNHDSFLVRVREYLP